jgi:hypothetical protein
MPNTRRMANASPSNSTANKVPKNGANTLMIAP